MNSIALYKVDWAVGSNPQPYFLTEDERTNYFNTASALQVNAAGVNIVFKPDFTANFVINVDYTVIENYNYIVANYNNSHYYMHIISYELVSYGYSRVYCTRDLFSEYINFLQYLQNFRLYKTNLYDLKFGINNGYLTNFIYRSYITSVSPNIRPVSSVLPNNVTTAKTFPVLLLFLKENTGFNGLTFPMRYNDIHTNYYAVVLPIASGNFYVYSPEGWENHNFSYYDYSLLLEQLSPLIVSYNMAYIYFATDGTNYYCPPGFEICTYPQKIDSESSITRYMLYIREYHNMFVSTTAAYYFEFDVSTSNFLDKYTLLVGQPDFKVDINLYDYFNETTNTFNFTVRFSYAFSDDGVSICLQILGQNTLSKNYLDYKLSFEFITSISFIIDQESQTLLQNKYYSQITAVNKNLKKDLGTMDVIESVGKGVSTGIGKMGGGDAFGGISAIANGIIGGVTAYGRAEIEADAYEEVRDLQLLNEMNKIPAVSTADNSFISSYISKGEIRYLHRQPYPNDYDYIIGMFNSNGLDCNKYINSLAITKSDFYIKCDCDNNSKLPTYIVNYFRDMLKSGCRFKRFGYLEGVNET